MRAWMVVAVVVAACSSTAQPTSPRRAPSAKPPPAVAGNEMDALWALAPEDVQAGVVASAHAVTVLDRLAKTPLFGALRSRYGDVTFASLGLAADRAVAVFSCLDGIVIVPVADRAKLAARIGVPLACKSIDRRLACATTQAAVDAIGKGKLGVAEVGRRGDVEAAVTDEVHMAAVAELTPGAVRLHGAIANMPARTTAMFGAPVKAAGDLAHAAGFFVMDVRPMLDGAHPMLRELSHTFAGPLVVTMPTSSGLPFAMRVALSDPAKAKKIIQHCDVSLTMLGATVDKGVCRVASGVPLLGTIEAWVENTELRVGARTQQPGPAVPLGAFGDELAGGSWSFVMYGHGSVLGTPVHDQLLQAGGTVAGVGALQELGVAGRMDGTTFRLVLAARTIWANPPDIANQLEALIATPSASRASEVTAIVKRAPTSPFAHDQAAGPSGMLGATIFGGLVFGLVIPAVFDTLGKPAQAEATAQLRKLGTAAETHRRNKGSYPAGKADLNPATPCCTGPNQQCAAAAWTDPVWTALRFAIKRPTRFQYAYRSDGKTFTATAIGDLDCDGISVVYTLTGNADGTTTLTEPTPGSD